jgi:hypothetical protein
MRRLPMGTQPALTAQGWFVARFQSGLDPRIPGERPMVNHAQLYDLVFAVHVGRDGSSMGAELWKAGVAPRLTRFNGRGGPQLNSRTGRYLAANSRRSYITCSKVAALYRPTSHA